MKKTQRQEAHCTKHPPITGPTTVLIEVKPDQVQIARPRRSRLNEALMMARLPRTSKAPPIPGWHAQVSIAGRLVKDRTTFRQV